MFRFRAPKSAMELLRANMPVPSQTTLKTHTPRFHYGLLTDPQIAKIKKDIKKARRKKGLSNKFFLIFDATDIREGACYHSSTHQVIGGERAMSVQDFVNHNPSEVGNQFGNHMWQFFLCSIDNKVSFYPSSFPLKYSKMY